MTEPAAAPASRGGLPREFDDLRLARLTVGDVSLRVRHGGSGPPLLLLHGYPETHLAWGLVAGDLARTFTVVAPDLRGYGDSSKPAPVPGHESHGKRAMAQDCVALMADLGFDRFDVVGHDRGGRVAYRLSLDHPASIRRLTVMDVIPTGEVWARADARFALGYWHWGFLAQPRPIPERLIAPDPEYFFFDAEFGGAIRGFPPAAVADYARCARDPAAIEGMCEDYRAGATCDRVADDEDRAAGRRIGCPTQVLWAGRGPLNTWYDPLAIWREWADDVSGRALDCGHFLAEERPGEVLAAILDFHAAAGLPGQAASS
ncbi:alpha/beta fold hydrolase [Modestobacter marinus]|uniref:alpha/beta fold hydrolase n=1 Tax=Modestobacter marinus TaxID=477641 RepID=UPI001C94462E|nr:alpha/beta hydrolase [Modestobacter marinus]